MSKPALRSLVQFETSLLLQAYEKASEQVKQQRQELQSTASKHVFVFVGNPRTGKTTLADFANMSRSAMHIDTDAYDVDTLHEHIQEDFRSFCEDNSTYVCLMTFGRHRHRFDSIWKIIRSTNPALFQNIQVTICRFERG